MKVFRALIADGLVSCLGRRSHKPSAVAELRTATDCMAKLQELQMEARRRQLEDREEEREDRREEQHKEQEERRRLVAMQRQQQQMAMFPYGFNQQLPTYSQHHAGPSYAQYPQNQVPHHLPPQQFQPPIPPPAQLPIQPQIQAAAPAISPPPLPPPPAPTRNVNDYPRSSPISVNEEDTDTIQRLFI